MSKDIEEKQRMIQLMFKNYGYIFPYKARYVREDNRIYFATDFKDGEEITFWWTCSKPSSCAEGYAFYANSKGESNLVNINELYSLD